MTLKGWLKTIYFGNLPENLRAFPYFGTKVYFPRDSLIFQMTCASGIYEWDNLRLLQTLAEEETLVLDVGANIGLMAVPLLASDKQLTVYSFEPSPNSLPYLQRTAQASAFGERWQVIGKAVGANPGSIDFHISDKGLGAFDGLHNTTRVNNSGIVRVPITTLDLEWTAIGKPRVSVIKIDVEGAEKLALEGAFSCIEQDRPTILVEWNISNLKASDCNLTWLQGFANNAGYTIHAVPGLAPVTNELALRAQMALTESFLLLPCDRARHPDFQCIR